MFTNKEDIQNISEKKVLILQKNDVLRNSKSLFRSYCTFFEAINIFCHN